MSIRSLFIPLVLFLWSSPLLAAASLEDQIAALLKRYHLDGAQVSIDTRIPATGQPLYRLHPNLALNPASTMKILTSVAALENLGPQHRYPTEFYSQEEPRDGALPDLWIKGYGNPFLVSEELHWIVDQLRGRGIRRIEGPVYVDDTYFNPERPLRYPGTTGRGIYRVVTGALSFNFNPPPALRYRARRWRDPAEDVPSPLQRSPQISKKMLDPALAAGLTFKEALQRKGIQVSGPVQFGRVTPRLKPLLFHVSRPLREIVITLNKFSHNFIAEQLFKSVGAARFGGPASENKGARALAEMLRRAGATTGSSRLHNGSGLSRDNRLAASHLVALLAYVLQAPYAEDFIRSLSIAGIDGTLYRRFKSSPLRGKVWAKTGSLYQVAGLAGYLLAGEQPLIFAIVVNGFNHSLRQVQRAEEKILEALAHYLEETRREPA